MGILSKARILIVDDEPLVLHSLSSIINNYGYEVDTCTSGEEAIKKIARSEYNLLLSDILLGGIDGFTLAAEARRINTGLQVILMTASPNPIDRQRAENENYQYLGKPIVADYITRLISDTLKESRKAA